MEGFVNNISQFEGCFDLISGRYAVDAKSVMGIFSFDLSQELEFRIWETSKKESEIMKAIKPFMTKE